MLTCGDIDIGDTTYWQVKLNGDTVTTDEHIKIEKVNQDKLKVTLLKPTLDSSGNIVPASYEIINTSNSILKNMNYKFKLHTWVTFDAGFMSQDDADLFCQHKGTQKRWRTFRVRGFEPYGIKDPYPYNLGPKEIWKIRSIVNENTQRSGFLNEWGLSVLNATLLRKVFVDNGAGNEKIIYFMEDHLQGSQHRPDGVSTILTIAMNAGGFSQGFPINNSSNIRTAELYENMPPIYANYNQLNVRGCVSVPEGQ